jgi:hypothetical protein
MRTSERRRRGPSSLLLLILLISVMVAVPAAADHPNEPLGTPLVTPTFVAGNDACPHRINNPSSGRYQFNVEGVLFVVDMVTDGTFF